MRSLIAPVRTKRAAVALIIVGETLLALGLGIAAFAWLRPVPSAAHHGREIAALVLTEASTRQPAIERRMPHPAVLAPARGVFLRIPLLGIDEVIHEGVSERALDLGVGHFPDTALPGARGNCALAAHGAAGVRHGAPFERLDELHAGDDVLLYDGTGREVRYVVSGRAVVDEHDLAVLRATRTPRLTLITCVVPSRVTHERLVVTAVPSQ